MEYKLEKNKKKKQIILIILTIILSLGITLGAVNFIYYFNDQRENSISTALITLNYTDKTGGNINLENTLPVIDQIGIENTPYEFSVTNTSKVPINVNFQIIENEETTIPLGAVRYALYINDELITKSHLANLDEDGNFYVFENVEPREKIDCKLVFWVDYYYEESNEIFSAKLKIIGESRDVIGEIEPTFVEIIKSKYGTDNTLVAVNTSGTLYNGEGEIREYRYSGPTANNYVFFDTNGDSIKTDDEVWRIIGVFKDTVKDADGNVVFENGQPIYEEKIKLMRNTRLTSAELPTDYKINGTTNTIENGTTGNVYWNKVKTGTNYNDWTTAGLQYYLNTEQDESTTPNLGYLSFLSSEAKALLSVTTYYLGNVVNYSVNPITPIKAYSRERGSSVVSGNQSSWNGYVGLLYASDFGYAAANDYWGTNFDDYGTQSIQQSNWMYILFGGNNMWYISPSTSSHNSSSADSNSVLMKLSSGQIGGTPTTGSKSCYPIVYLKTTSIVNDATGTVDNPYVVVIED